MGLKVYDSRLEHLTHGLNLYVSGTFAMLGPWCCISNCVGHDFAGNLENAIILQHYHAKGATCKQTSLPSAFRE